MLERSRPWREVDEKGWKAVGRCGVGEILLAESPRQVSVMYRWQEGRRMKHLTIATFFHERRHQRALREARAEIRVDRRRVEREARAMDEPATIEPTEDE